MTSCLFRGSTNWEDKDNSFDDSFQGWISNYDDDAGVDDEDVDGEDEEEDDDDDNYNAFDDTPSEVKEWRSVCLNSFQGWISWQIMLVEVRRLF